MKQIAEYTRVQDMEGKQKESFADFLRKNYSGVISKFLEANKNFIKGKLTNSNKDIFENEVLKRKQLQSKFLLQILEKLDDEKYRDLINKIIKFIFSSDSDLSASITKNKEYEDESLIAFLAKLNDSEKKTMLEFFAFIGTNFEVNEEEVAEQKESLKAGDIKKSYEAKLAKAEKDLKEAKEKYAKDIKATRESEQKAKDEAKEKEKQIKKKEDLLKEKDKALEAKDETIKDKEKAIKGKEETIKDKDKEIQAKDEAIKGKDEEIAEKNRTIEELTALVDALKKEPAEPRAIDKEIAPPATEKKAEPDRSKALQAEKIPQVSYEKAVVDLEKRTLLGVVKPDGLYPEKGYVVVTPIIPIIDDNSRIDREDFTQHVDYRSNYSSFLLFLNKDYLLIALSEEVAIDYPSLNIDQKYNVLYDAFVNKIVFFAPYFPEIEGEKRKLNADLLSAPIPFKDFRYSTFVPSFYGTKKEFESTVKNHEDLFLENYPNSLSNNLKYIWVEDSIYEVNYASPAERDEEGIRWKYNGQSGKEPFRRLGIKTGKESTDDYLITPSAVYLNANDIYVTNNALAKASEKAASVFDESEFISKVSKNAQSKNLYYTEKDLKNFHVAIKSSNLVILAGPSGIGKTKLPMVYANTLGLDAARNTVLFVPISPSYLEPEDVLGFIRPISEESGEYNAEYMESQTGLVSFLIDAANNRSKIHLVIFDEMNLSQIEHWFAPFISLLEQDPDSRALNLYSDNLKVKNEDVYPSSVNIGENVFFIGTVNIDETTKQISDRLLDRAIVINLAAPSFVSLKDMGAAEAENYTEVSFERYATMIAKVGNSATEFSDKEFALLNELNVLLTDSVYNKSISFRSLNKMALYLKNSKGILSRGEAFDFVVSQIVIKKINGSKEELGDILCDDDTRGILKVLGDHSEISDFSVSKKAVHQKIQEIDKYGFTR